MPNFFLPSTDKQYPDSLYYARLVAKLLGKCLAAKKPDRPLLGKRSGASLI
ncbi:MAG: hypothetical protein ACE3JK_11290 [Sporolactobacillus sp.]